MSQELVNSVNKLTDETSALLQEYVKGNTVLQNSASDAASSAAAAKASENNSVNQANTATQKAAEAKQYRDETAAIVTGGTATIDPSPGKIPLANSEGKISSGWLTALAFARTKADMDAMRESVNRQCAASGMIHAGIGHTVDNVNEGLWGIRSGPTRMIMGKSGMSSGHIGSSKTDYPVFNLAGFPVSLRGVNATSLNQAQMRFPQAPDGTDIYDSSGNCRGTGKPTLNLLTEVDPKYGDVAPNVNEAVARAFEGVVKNGDIRNGTSGWSSISGSSVSLVDGKLRAVSTPTSNTLLYQNNLFFSEANQYEVVIKYWSNQGISVRLNQNYVASEVFPTGNGSEVRKVISGKNGSVFNISGGGANAELEIEYIYIRPITEEVVTERVDLSGLEVYLEEITPAKPYIYPYCGINNQATSVDGIATTIDNVRPITYFANFDGDTTSRGRGWNLNDLTDAQLLTILQSPDHHVYVIDGRLVQFRFRPREIKGAGNGDWERVSANDPVSGSLSYSTLARVTAQGSLDIGGGYSSATFRNYRTTASSDNSKPNKGIFSVRDGDALAYNGECYFYVLATVLRLNHGAYHPSLNPLGTGQFSRDLNNSGKVDQGVPWNNGSLRQELSPKTKADCFGPVLKYNSDISGPSRYSHYTDGFYLSGSIASARSGRPDGKFYDAIYPDGEGGVIDRRLSAFPITMEDYFKAMAKAENGTMRGMEKLKNTFVIDDDAVPTKPPMFTLGGDSWTYFPVGVKWQYRGNNSKHGAPLGRNGYAIYSDGSVYSVIVYSDTSLNIVWEGQGNLNAELLGKDLVNIVFSEYTNLSVSGNFLQTDVIGDPANILQVDALKNGWMGSWIPQIPDGVKSTFQLTRKNLQTGNITRLFTSDDGVTWTQNQSTFYPETNTNITLWGADVVNLYQYTASAKVTKPSAVLPVYGSRSGLGPVITTEHNAAINGALMGESLMGKVLTASAANTGLYAIPLSLLRLDPATGKLAGYDQPKHAAIPLVAPNNNSPAIKVLPHAASNNGQATLGFAWNEIKHDGTSWNDDGTMRVIDNTGTYNNLKPESCLYGYAELALPIGWVDNHARFGAQVPGVDL